MLSRLIKYGSCLLLFLFFIVLVSSVRIDDVSEFEGVWISNVAKTLKNAPENISEEKRVFIKQEYGKMRYTFSGSILALDFDDVHREYYFRFSETHDGLVLLQMYDFKSFGDVFLILPKVMEAVLEYRDGCLVMYYNEVGEYFCREQIDKTTGHTLAVENKQTLGHTRPIEDINLILAAIKPGHTLHDADIRSML